MNVGWQHYRAVAGGAPGGVQSGIARGYLRLAYFLHEALRHAGVRLVDVPEAEAAHPRIALHVCPPHCFRPVPKKINVLLSMWEGGALPPEIVSNLKRADWHVVPSAFCRDIWRAHGVDSSVVPLGVTPAFAECDASRSILRTPESRLRFLFLASKLGRKGWELAGSAWQKAFPNRRDVQMYVKTIGDGSLAEHFQGRVILDQRDLEEREILDLYRSASVFAFPSFGEGFGLPALEAMASGCLVIAPPITGLREFVNEYTALLLGLGKPVRADYGGEYTARFPTVDTLASAMRTAADLWGTPKLETIRRTGTNHARKFTWEAAGKRLRSVLEGIAFGKARKCA